MYNAGSPSRDYLMGYKDILYSLILGNIDSRANINILDIGCKDGIDLRNVLTHKKIKGYGLDINRQLLHRSAEQSKEYRSLFFIQGRGEELPFKDKSMDIIMSSEVIEHIEEVPKFLCEINRILRPNSYLFITTPSRYSYTTIIGRFIPGKFKKSLRKLIYYGQNEKDGIKNILPGGTIVKEHVREYMPGELKKLINSNGFEVVIIRQGFLNIPLSPVFDRFPSLIKCWAIFDKLISVFPFSIHLKANFIVAAKKHPKSMETKENMKENINSQIYDSYVISQGLQFQIDNYYEPKDILSKRRIETVLEAINPKLQEKILDIGCGVGTLAFHCAKLNASSIGIDYSKESIKVAQLLSERYGVSKNAKFLVANAIRLPFKDYYFDKVVAADFIEHVTLREKEELVREIYRVLKPDGVGVIFTPNGIREKIGKIYWQIRHLLFGDKISTTRLHFGLTNKYELNPLLEKLKFNYSLVYKDIKWPYLGRLPLVRNFLALYLLWIIKKI